MNWEALGAVGEIAGAIGVIVTLVYLATQIRQNTKAARLSAVQVAVEGSARWNELIVQDGDLNALFWRGLMEPASLTPEETRRVIGVIAVFFRRESHSYYLYKEGNMPEALWAARVRSLSGILNQPGTRLFIDSAGDTLPDEFREFLLSVMSSGSTLSPAGRRIFHPGGAGDAGGAGEAGGAGDADVSGETD